MLLLSSSSLLQVVTSSTAEIDARADYVDNLAGAITPAPVNTAHIVSAVTTTIVGSPTTGAVRNVKSASLHNSDASASNTVTVQHTDGTTVETLIKYTLLAGETLFLKESGEWVVIDSNGGLKNTPGVGRVLIRAKASGTTYTTGPGTNTIYIRMWAGGGAGGGGASTASDAAVGGGGAAGGYLEKTVSVTPSTAYTIAIGAGGTAGTAGNNPGNTGGNSTFTIGATTYTANGGPGGTGMAAAVTAGTASAGGSPPAVSTNGDVNASGSSGGASYRTSGTVGRSGKGGDSSVGGGGAEISAQGTGNTATGFAAGGGGGACLNGGSAVAGGAGAPGLIVVEEYS